jgi:CubicO group peptidase (beta-lactamase class C family)
MGAQQIDATVMRMIKAAVPGAVIAILNRDHVVYEKAYGYREAEKKLPLTADSVYLCLASCTQVQYLVSIPHLAPFWRTPALVTDNRK